MYARQCLAAVQLPFRLTFLFPSDFFFYYFQPSWVPSLAGQRVWLPPVDSRSVLGLRLTAYLLFMPRLTSQTPPERLMDVYNASFSAEWWFVRKPLRENARWEMPSSLSVSEHKSISGWGLKEELRLLTVMNRCFYCFLFLEPSAPRQILYMSLL